jgi:hypothetical protein
MRNLFLFPACLIVILLFSACTKPGAGSSGGGNTNANLLVSSFSVHIYDSTAQGNSTQYTVIYSFDNQNRQSTAFQNGSATYNGTITPISDSFYFSYSSGASLEIGNEHNDGVFTQATIHNYLGGPDNYPDSSLGTSQDGNAFFYLNSQYSYDANGYCTQILENAWYSTNNAPSTNSTDTYIITSGNVTEMDINAPAYGEAYVETLTYGKTSNNTTVSPSIPPYQGHPNNNLVESTQSSMNGVVTSALNYAYSFDNQNRVTSITVTTPSGFTFMTFTDIQYLQ